MVLVSLGMAAGAAAADYYSKKQAAKQNFSYQKQLSNLNFEQQKYFAQNAHQMEMEDLKTAGLNPALTATGGSGASASGGGIPGSPGIQPLDMIGGLKTLIDAKNQTSATQSQNDLNRAQAMNTIANTDNIPYQNRVNMINALAAQQQAEAATTNAKTNKKALKYQDMNAQSNWRNSISNKYLSDAQIENLRKQGTVIKGGLPSKWFGTWWHDF